MVTSGDYYIYIGWFDIYPEIKELFGNRKNYVRYLDAFIPAEEWRQWNKWLIGLGWRDG